MGVYSNDVVRKQIVVPPEVDAHIRALAARLGISQSAVIARAVMAFPDPQSQLESILAFAGAIVGDGPSNASEEVDEVVYGWR
jgi:hypothetical protein